MCFVLNIWTLGLLVLHHSTSSSTMLVRNALDGWKPKILWPLCKFLGHTSATEVAPGTALKL